MMDPQFGRALRLVWTGPGATMAGLAGLGDWILRAGYDGPVPNGMGTLVDFDLSHAPAASALPPVFEALPALSVDPRTPVTDQAEAVALLSGLADADALAAWAGAAIMALPADGVRLLGLDRLPAHLLPRVLEGLRRAAPGRLLLGWMAGLSRTAVAGLPPGALDAVAASLPWWDGHAPWLWEELADLQRVAPVILPASATCEGPVRWAALAAVLGDGWLIPAPAIGSLPAGSLRGARHVLSAPGAPVLAILRTDTADMRQAQQATLVLTALTSATVPAGLLAAMGRPFGPFLTADGQPLDGLHLTQDEGVILQATALDTDRPAQLATHAARLAGAAPRLALEAPAPTVDYGRFPARRLTGEDVAVSVDLISEGHDKLAGCLRWTAPGSDAKHEVALEPLGNDRWGATLPLRTLGVHHFTLHAWRDEFSTFADGLRKKFAAGVPVTLELQEGAALVAQITHAAHRKHGPALATLQATLRDPAPEVRLDALLSPETAALMQAADPRAFMTEIGPFPLQAERAGAAHAAWYEVFPRSLSNDPARHGTLRDVIRHLPRIQAMGFDVLYFPPIHPIGTRNRKGRNNTLTPGADDPGSPYAIGAATGGHDAIHPELGSLEDFQALRHAAAQHGMELALDFAIQCSPDHPWLAQHKDWFTWRPDGTIRYAENPPKKYEDIVNVDFYARDAVPSLWLELCQVVLFWAEQGVKLFRVDNPHTKPFPFWEWMISEVQARYPDTIFLAEAFTRPKVMYRLAKIGFSQSYTYFTWREKKWEFEQYLTELVEGPPAEFFRPHFFVNTPDINPIYLQGAGRGSYLARAALAATLSGLWGLYNGFELCEGTPVPDKEEYLDSEKYQLRAWDWDRPGNIVAEISQLNAIRRANPALHSHIGVRFLRAGNEAVLLFEKATADRSNVLWIAISLDVRGPQSTDAELPFWRYAPEPAALAVTDLLTGAAWSTQDRTTQLTLPPDRPYAIWRMEPQF